MAVSPSDKSIVEQYGVSVIDCSWANVDQLPVEKLRGKYERLRILLL